MRVPHVLSTPKLMLLVVVVESMSKLIKHAVSAFSCPSSNLVLSKKLSGRGRLCGGYHHRRSLIMAASPGPEARAASPSSRRSVEPTRAVERTPAVTTSDSLAFRVSAGKNLSAGPNPGHNVWSTLNRRGGLSLAAPLRPSPPDYWREQLEGVRHMRRSRDAAVDTAGAEALKDASAGTPVEVRFQVLMSAMLSSQTKDPVTAAALERMREACAPSSLGAAALATAMAEDALAALLHPVSFANTKAKHIKMVCERLSEAEEGRAAGDIPSTVGGLLDLPGVGPKMTFLVMDVAWGRNEGICVDTHVHRISNRLGWVDTWNRKRPRTQNPEKTRKHLQLWLPREHWYDSDSGDARELIFGHDAYRSEINELLVGFGQRVCSAIGPSCSTCEIRHMCPSAETKGNLSWRDALVEE